MANYKTLSSSITQCCHAPLQIYFLHSERLEQQLHKHAQRGMKIIAGLSKLHKITKTTTLIYQQSNC